MNRQRPALLWFAVMVFVFSLACLQPAEGQVFSASIRGLQITKGERIVGFQIRLKSARFFSLPSVPLGWDISIDNDPSWHTEMKGTVEVGAGALDPDFLRDFVVVEKDTTLGLPFEAEGEIDVTKDFEHVRKINFGTNDFVLKTSRRGAPGRRNTAQ